MKRIACVILCALAALLAGCASTQPSQFYTLSPAPLPAMATMTDASISVGPVLIPAVIDRPQIVLKTGPNSVSIDEFHRWASPLPGAIARVIAEDLASLLGTQQLTVFPQSPAVEASYRVGIDLLHFESEPGKSATLDALWRVNTRKEGLSHTGRTTITEPTQGGGYNGLAAAHSRALGRLSGEIAAAIREMESQKRANPVSPQREREGHEP